MTVRAGVMEGTRVRLRALEQGDAELFASKGRDFPTRLLAQGGIPYPAAPGDYASWLSSVSFKNDDYVFVIELIEETEVIGYCSVANINWKGSVATVGINLFSPLHQGKGYGTEATSLLVDFIFRYINVNKVKLGVFSFNERAIKSYEKCGFVVEGRWREEIFREGAYHDVVWMGILRREWETAGAGF